MKLLANVLEESTIETLLGIAGNVLSGNSGNHKVWTNLAWDPRLVSGSNPVICIAVPDSLVPEIEETLIESEILNPRLYERPLTSSAMSIYIWPNGSFITPHRDSGYAQAVSIYLTKYWSLGDGGLFCFVSDEGIRCVIPDYNTGAQNDKAELHFTTPVTSDKMRISLQIFVPSTPDW